ncbi:unnamed protein product [Paramecium sonneborni]|uniref:Uncharacterized protein n=1 Tax=Paramecium sonneborni TaxID=65129 RepID=A0A8S1R6T5_9CILI|nr:unnamed protein product [Paramecium sonneborni]
MQYKIKTFRQYHLNRQDLFKITYQSPSDFKPSTSQSLRLKLYNQKFNTEIENENDPPTPPKQIIDITKLPNGQFKDTRYMHTDEQKVFIIKYFKTIFTPLKLYSAIVTQKRDLIFLNNPQIYIKIEILNKIITQPQIYETLIDKSIKTFSIQIEINCKNIVQIKSLFRNCQNCLFQQNYHSNHYCSSNLTLLTFNFKLTQSILSYQQLIFIVEQSRFTLKQVLTNYVETEVELIDIILV